MEDLLEIRKANRNSKALSDCTSPDQKLNRLTDMTSMKTESLGYRKINTCQESDSTQQPRELTDRKRRDTPPYRLSEKASKEDLQSNHAVSEKFIVLPDGSRYRGEIVGGKRNGQGTLVYPDASVYTGAFVDGIPEGKGQLIHKMGINTKAIFTWVKLMVKASSLLLAVAFTKGSGLITDQMGTAKRRYLMVPNTQACGIRVKSMARG